MLCVHPGRARQGPDRAAAQRGRRANLERAAAGAGELGDQPGDADDPPPARSARRQRTGWCCSRASTRSAAASRPTTGRPGRRWRRSVRSAASSRWPASVWLSDGEYAAFFHDDGRYFRGSGQADAVHGLPDPSADGGLTWQAPTTVWSGSRGRCRRCAEWGVSAPARSRCDGSLETPSESAPTRPRRRSDLLAERAPSFRVFSTGSSSRRCRSCHDFRRQGRLALRRRRDSGRCARGRATLNAQGAVATLDFLGEEVADRDKALAAVDEYVALFDVIAAESSTPTSRSS